MSLLQWGRNFIVAEIDLLTHNDTSANSLQWGRNFIVAEIPQEHILGNPSGLLQWGRNFIVAEMDVAPWRVSGRRTCFNGAATLSLRKCEPLPADLSTLARLQWGRNFIVAEMCVWTCAKVSILSLQWGRNFIVAEMSSAYPHISGQGELQWGRNFIVAETIQGEAGAVPNAAASMGPQRYCCGNITR